MAGRSFGNEDGQAVCMLDANENRLKSETRCGRNGRLDAGTPGALRVVSGGRRIHDGTDCGLQDGAEHLERFGAG